jgi:hypothetical protein
MARHELRDIIIVLPGIMGSVLRKGEADLWAPTLGAAYRGLRGGLGQDLALESGAPDIDETLDGVRATELVALPSIFPRFWKTDGYSSLRAMIFSDRPGVWGGGIQRRNPLREAEISKFWSQSSW